MKSVNNLTYEFWKMEVTVYCSILYLQRCLEKRFVSSEPLSELATDDFLVQAFEAYCKLEVVLHQKVRTQSF